MAKGEGIVVLGGSYLGISFFLGSLEMLRSVIKRNIPLVWGQLVFSLIS